jgi:hypothetical protein
MKIFFRAKNTNRILAGILAIFLAGIGMGCENSRTTAGDGGLKQGDSRDGEPNSLCTGVKANTKTASCSGGDQDDSGTVDEDASQAGPTRVGARAPCWKLRDFQPQSCGYGLSYGLARFRGYTTLVGLFSGWCEYCQSQTVQLERMRQELLEQGHDVQFVLINSADAAGDQKNLVDRCAFPLFQDTKEVNAFGLHGGAKDDLYIYDKKGVLSAYLPGSGEAGPTVLTSSPGYDNVYSAIMAAE